MICNRKKKQENVFFEALAASLRKEAVFWEEMSMEEWQEYGIVEDD